MENKMLQYEQCLNEVLTGNESEELHNRLKIQHVLEFIQENLSNINKKIQMADLLKVLHHSICLESRYSNGTIPLDPYVLKMLDAGDMHSENLEPAIQILYQILQTLLLERSTKGKQAFSIGNELFCKLNELLVETNLRPNLKANILACYQLYAHKNNKNEAVEILETLWRKIESGIAAGSDHDLQTLITLFDEFEQIEHFKKTMQSSPIFEKLLNSEEHDKRKCAYFLLKKSHVFMQGSPQFWTNCISIFENLEENQSHLILPSLELLKKIELKPTSEEELRWLNILYEKILKHNNILVRRWIIEYFLEYRTFRELTPEIGLFFMEALNETSLYNIEGYMLPTTNIANFLSISMHNFFKFFSQINWKAVPLFFWLYKLRKICQSIPFAVISDNESNALQLLLNLAAKVRVLQNVTIRRVIVEALFKALFSEPIARMNLAAYVELIKTLYNTTDLYLGLGTLLNKLETYPTSLLETNCQGIFDQRFYELIANNLYQQPACKKVETGINIFQKLKNIDCLSHGYLSLFVLFNCKESIEKQTFCQRSYDLDLDYFVTDELSQIKSFNEFYNLLCEKLGKIIENKVLLKQRAMDYYICTLNYENFKNFDDLQKCFLNFDDLISIGTAATLVRAANLLALNESKVTDNILECFLNGLREYLKNFGVCYLVVPNLLKYLLKFYEPKDCAFWAKKILELDIENQQLTELILRNELIQFNDEEFLLQGALRGDAKTGDARIEESYALRCHEMPVKSFRIRLNYMHQIQKESDTLKKSIVIKVCEMAEALNLKKSRYFAHSKEHRMLTRMTYLLWSLINAENLKNLEIGAETIEQIFEKLWSLLMNYNNQPNVAIILECLLASIANYTKLMDKIMALQAKSSCTSSQEVSMIMLLYRYFEANSEKAPTEEFSQVITFLWPLTMGSRFQTRLYAQLVLVVLIEKLLKKHNDDQTALPELRTFTQLKNAIDQMIGAAKIARFLKDVRFTTIKTENFFTKVMYLTQQPYDEYDKNRLHFLDEKYDGKKFKLLDAVKSEMSFEQHQNVLANADSSTSNCIVTDVQRKLNPIADFMPQPNLISYPTDKENELFVVASFIDKIPNLGGIARTCEVLGIKNLVMASKADITKADFKNLSMTAEKTLNIIEVKPNELQNFLIQKKCEGFKIVGAEQTANSCNFVDFQFPKRSVLLLGHEKEGIPPNFLGFLDYAVEIPQFGMVRSLNVHVTGALFMWEYCKQHICQKKC